MDEVNFLLAAVSTVGSLIAIWELYVYLRDRERITWRVVDKALRSSIRDMNDKDYKPDLILGVGRGGAIVAGMLAGNLGHITLAVLDSELDRSTGVNRVTILHPDCMPDITGLSVLVCVGELYSGEDLKEGIAFVEARNPRELQSYSMFAHPAASVRPDFVGKRTDKPLGAPWRVTDVYRTRRL